MQIYLPDSGLIIELHDVVIEVSGGRTGILNENVIHAAVDRPKTYLSYHDDADIHTACAVLLDSLARNHAFVEGNKRTALLSILLAYELNEIMFNFNKSMQTEFEDLVLWVVMDKPKIDELAEKLRELVGKHGSTGMSSWIQKLKSLLTPFSG